jgi:Zn-dependent peptidase ImmA (M78 family)/transcriptional regulator with XRE-family HTH domain
MKTIIPVNPVMLRWARETAGLQVEIVAQKLNKDVKDILSWESEPRKDSPTYVQLEKLAYEIYKRPLAIFFFPEPPQEESPKQSFRTLPEQEILMLTPRLRFLIRQARLQQLNLSELYDNINPVARHIIRGLSFSPNISVLEMASNVRKYFNIDLITQFSWKNVGMAFKNWRNILEEHGIFVFKEAFKTDDFSGFCLYDKQFPVIYVDNSKPDSRQIFTLFHELAHLLLGTGGVDTRLEHYIKFLQGDNRAIEILCNRFGGEFLVPDSDFNQRIVGVSINDESIQRLADQYCVSREVILRKFLDRNKVDQQYYNTRVEQWAKVAGKSVEGGGNYYLTKGVYLGERYIEKAFNKYYQKNISIEQLAEYLNVKVKNVSGMESLLLHKGAES